MGSGVGVAVGLVGVGVGLARVAVGVGDSVGVGVGVSVGVGVGVGVGVRLGVGVVVGVLVGVGVMDGVSEGVSVGTSNSTGTSLAIACTVLTATAGLKLSKPCRNHGPTTKPTTIPNNTAPVIHIGRSQSCRSGSPQPGHTSNLRLLTLPHVRQRACPGCRCGLPQWGHTSCPVEISVPHRLHFFTELLPHCQVDGCNTSWCDTGQPDPIWFEGVAESSTGSHARIHTRTDGTNL